MIIDLERTKDLKIKMNGKIYDIVKISSRQHKSECQLLFKAIDMSEDVKEKLKIIDEIKSVVNDIEQALLQTRNILNNTEV